MTDEPLPDGPALTPRDGSSLAADPTRTLSATSAAASIQVSPGTPATAPAATGKPAATPTPALAEMSAAATMEQTPDAPAWAARKLLRAARAGTLATTMQGQPFASLVTPATAPDLSILLLLSDLSEHTRHLRADPRCSVLVCGVAEAANPQTAPRVTVTGLAETVADAALRARYLAVHPYASLYVGFGDFALWRIRPINGLYVGGFARAARLRAADLAPDPAAVAAIAASAEGIIEHCNADHPDAMAAIAQAPGEWRMASVDVDGCDLACGESIVRVAWSAPASDSGDVRRELIRLARHARG